MYKYTYVVFPVIHTIFSSVYICDWICKTYHLHTRDIQNNCKYFTELDVFAWNIFNYYNNCRNTFGWPVTQSHRGAKSEILIISLVCRW